MCIHSSASSNRSLCSFTSYPKSCMSGGYHPRTRFMPARPLEMRSTVASALADKDRMVERDMHRADDADALRHGGDRSRPGERFHQVAAVVIVAAERLPVRRGNEALEPERFGFLRQSDVGIPGALEAIRMKREGGAIAVGGENAELDAIFGVADGVRFWVALSWTRLFQLTADSAVPLMASVRTISVT